MNRLKLPGVVASGLIHIHEREMIHRDLKGVHCQNPKPIPYLTVLTKANILIDQTGNARLADHGLLVVLPGPANLVSSSSYTGGGTARWIGP